MRAWVLTRLGSPRAAMSLQPSFPSPSVHPPTGTSLLIHISYAALNPADAHFMTILTPLLPFRRRPIPGLDFSGVVVSSGPDATLAPGTKVCGALSVGLVAWGSGSLAEYVLVPEGLVAVVPKGMELREAAGLGIVGQTAVIAHREADGLEEGSRVLVNGASGGLGAMITQIAKGRGARVTGVCSGGNGEFVRGLGADETIDYTAHEPLHQHLAEKYSGDNQFDYIFDCVGDQVLYEKSPPYLKPEGKFICLVGGKTQGVVPYVKNNLWPTRIFWGTPRTYKILGLAPAGELQREVVRMVEKGWIKTVPVDSEFGMEEAVEAYERVLTKRARGKVVVKVSEE
ncbi:hypothetical protein GE09DRAFT_986167 [Coniochaeta sp. 2T2.1]|nr:hypothetical protein GE09DRAFT_986167 [Coniochaeta sp. 2T2.1]